MIWHQLNIALSSKKTELGAAMFASDTLARVVSCTVCLTIAPDVVMDKAHSVMWINLHVFIILLKHTSEAEPLTTSSNNSASASMNTKYATQPPYVGGSQTC